jgi:hypothetical protein
MTVEIIKCIEIVPKRHAFKTRSYNSAELKNWVDFGSVRKNFCYSERLRLRRFISFLTELMTNCDVFSSSFLTSSISAITSCGKRISTRFDLLLCLPVAIFYKLFSCLYRQYITKKSNKKGLTCRDTIIYIVVTPFNYIGVKITIAQRVRTSMSYLTTITLTEVMIMANRYDSAHLCARQSKPSKSSKKHLHNLNHSGYIDNALAKSKVRIGTLNSYLATHDAQCVFFCVNACAHLFINISSMVALVGQPKGWLGHRVTSSSNPANVTAKEIGTSCGDYVNNYSEAVAMTTIPTTVISNQKLFKFYDLSTAQVVQTTATTECQARKSLGKSSLIFIARIRLYPMVKNSINFGRV